MYVLLAQFKLDGDLINIIILVAIVALGALGHIAKKLIVMFTPPEKQIPFPKTPAIQQTVVRPTVPPVLGRPGPVAHGAPPLPPSPRLGVPLPTMGPPVVRRPPPVAPVIFVEVDDVAEPLPPRARPVARPVAPPTPAPTPQLTRRPRREAAPACTETRLGHLKPEVLQEEVRFEAGAKARMMRRGPTVPEEERHFEEGLGGRLGYADVWIPRAEVRKPMTVLGRLSPRALRHAIVLREVLGPPVALRPYDDPSHGL